MPKDINGWLTLVAFVLAGAISGYLHAGGPDFAVLGVHSILATALGWLALAQVPKGAAGRITDLEAKLGVPRAPRPPSLPLNALILVIAAGVALLPGCALWSAI